jgi:hypothetical protein
MHYIFETDKKKIDTFLEKHGMSISDKAVSLIAEYNGEIKAVLGIRNVAFIEPLVSENPIAGLNLVMSAEQIIKDNGQGIIRIICKEEREKLFNRWGFEKQFENQIIMEKILK